MEKKLISLQELKEEIKRLEILNSDINNLKEKYKDYYFNWITPFKIFYISNSDFSELIKSIEVPEPYKNIMLSKNTIHYDIGEADKAKILVFTEVEQLKY